MPDAAENTSASRPSSGRDTGAAPAPRPAESEGADAREQSLTDSIADLLQMAVNYLRQETASVMRDKVVLPGQQLGKMVAFALAASFLLALGLAFLSVALLLVLAGWLTWPGALGLIGGILVIGAGIFTALKVRSTQE
jgi:hypothetical protein